MHMAAICSELVLQSDTLNGFY